MLLDAMAGCVFPAMAKCELQWYKLRLSSLAESRVKPEMQPQISVGISYSPIFLGRQTFKAISIKVENVIETLKDAIKIAINAVCEVIEEPAHDPTILSVDAMCSHVTLHTRPD